MSDADVFFGGLFFYLLGASIMYGWSIYWDTFSYPLSWFTRLFACALSGTLFLGLFLTLNRMDP